MARAEHQGVVEQLFSRLQGEFGSMAPQIIQVMVEVVGGYRISFPDFQDLYRAERNRRIRNEFNGANHQELAIKYRLGVKQTRRIVRIKRELQGVVDLVQDHHVEEAEYAHGSDRPERPCLGVSWGRLGRKSHS